MPKALSNDSVLLKHLPEKMLSESESDKGKIVHLEEEKAPPFGLNQNRQPAPRPRKLPYLTKLNRCRACRRDLKTRP
ncbi:hypothetical protein SAMN04490206_1075 [Pseudomonas umsongensis]|nr:hypothetical protein SAMN04490206_1075 [Pseudomonas umsongensis]